MKKVVIVSACRSAIAKAKMDDREWTIPPVIKLGGEVIKKAIYDAGVPINRVDHVIMGCVNQENLGQNPARQAACMGNLPCETTATTINSVCGSGLDSINMAAQMIQSDNADIVVAGGMEYMSSYMNNIDKILEDFIQKVPMIYLGELIANKYKISREEADEFAYSSYCKYINAFKSGKFFDETVSIKPFCEEDNCFRECALDELSNLKNVSGLTTGILTAGNSTCNADGAAVVVMMSEEKAKELNIHPMATFVGGCLGGTKPSNMCIGSVISTNKLLRRLNLSINDIDLIELNEAFASQVIATCRELNIDMNKLNVNGGSIAMGHPIGASGARILVTLIHEMKRRKVKRGLATISIGGGMGCSTIIEMDNGGIEI